MNNVFELKMYMLELYHQGDILLSQGKLPTKDAQGLLTGWEYSPDKYHKYGDRYIGLAFHSDIWNSTLWKQAEDELVEEGRLIRDDDPDWPHHFKYVPGYMKEVLDCCEKELVVPYQLKELHSTHLKSDFWKKKKEEILDRDEHECQLCGCKENLQVHHMSYDHLGCEHNDELVTLCDKCHKEYGHKFTNKEENDLD